MNPILFFFGYSRIKADALSATRLLNLCLEHSFSFSGFEGQEDGGISFFCPKLTAKKLLRLAEQDEITVTVERIGGLPEILFRRCRRYGLILGAVCGMILVFMSGRVVWDVRVSGNQRLTAAEVTEELSNCGFGVGSSLKNFQAGELENRVLMQSEELSWISIYMDGTVAMVQVLEQTDRPNATSKNPANLVASCDGQIEAIELLRGDCVVKVGQAVRQGDLLVSGIYDGQAAGLRFTRAAGQIFARTERTYRIEIPLETTEKHYLHEKKGEIWINFFQKAIKIFKSTGNEIGKYDIIKKTIKWTLSGGRVVPVGITAVEQRSYVTRAATRTAAEAYVLAQNELEARLAADSTGRSLLEYTVERCVSADGVTLLCTVVCEEDIARVEEFDVASPQG